MTIELREEPCEKTGKGCDWVWEEWEDREGNYWDNCYCYYCHRARDWDLAEFEEVNEN